MKFNFGELDVIFTSKVSRVTVEAVRIQLGQILDFSDLHSATFGRLPDDFG